MLNKHKDVAPSRPCKDDHSCSPAPPSHAETSTNKRASTAVNGTSGTRAKTCDMPHLPAALWPCPNANGWYVECLCDCCCNRCRDALQHNGKTAAVLQGLGLVDHTHSLTCDLSLRPETTCRQQTLTGLFRLHLQQLAVRGSAVECE